MNQVLKFLNSIVPAIPIIAVLFFRGVKWEGRNLILMASFFAISVIVHLVGDLIVFCRHALFSFPPVLGFQKMLLNLSMVMFHGIMDI